MQTKLYNNYKRVLSLYKRDIRNNSVYRPRKRITQPNQVVDPSLVHKSKSLFMNSTDIYEHLDEQIRTSKRLSERLWYLDFLEDLPDHFALEGSRIFIKQRDIWYELTYCVIPYCEDLSLEYTATCARHSRRVVREMIRTTEAQRLRKTRKLARYFKNNKNLSNNLQKILEEEPVDLREEISLVKLSLEKMLQKAVENKGEDAIATANAVSMISETVQKLANVVKTQDKIESRRQGSVTIKQMIAIVHAAIQWMLTNWDEYDHETNPRDLLLRILPELPIPHGVLRVDDVGTISTHKGAVLLPAPKLHEDEVITLMGEWNVKDKQRGEETQED